MSVITTRTKSAEEIEMDALLASVLENADLIDNMPDDAIEETIDTDGEVKFENLEAPVPSDLLAETQKTIEKEEKEIA